MNSFENVDINLYEMKRKVLLRDDKHSSGVIDFTVRTVGGCNIVDFADQQCDFKAFAVGILQFFVQLLTSLHALPE